MPPPTTTTSLCRLPPPQPPSRNYQIQFPILLLISLSVTIGAFSPADHYLINSSTVVPTTIDLDNGTFTGDESLPILSSTTSVTVNNHNTYLNFSPIYHSASVFTKPSFYKFKIKEKGMKLVRIHFLGFEINPIGNACHDQFHVSANDFVLLNNYSVSKRNPIIKDFLIFVDDDELLIRFRGCLFAAGWNNRELNAGPFLIQCVCKNKKPL